MKALIISSNSSGRGGGEKYITFLIRGLIELNWEVEVLLSSVSYMDAWAVEFEKQGAKIIRAELKGLSQRRFRFIEALLDRAQQKKVAEICRSVGADLIMVNQQYDEDGLDYLRAVNLQRNCKVAGVIHMPMTNHKNSRPFGKLRGRLIGRYLNKSSHAIVFSSIGSEKEFSDYYDHDLKTCVVPSGVFTSDTYFVASEDVADYERSIFSEPRVYTIGTACQFVEQKNLISLANAWIFLRAKGLAVNLLLIGDGPLRNELENILAQSGYENWRITGWSDNYYEYVKHLDLFVAPSHFESMPLTVLEVVGSGIPCVISKFNGAPEIAERAYWVEVLASNTAEDIARLIEDKLAQNITPLSEDVRAFRDFFSTKRMAEDLLGQLGVTQRINSGT